jgi:PAS domain S-box-containing protein
MTQANKPTSEAITDALLAGIVMISADAIICLDDSQRIIFFNEGAESIFGYDAEEVVGQPIDLLIPSRYRASHSRHVENFGDSNVRARKMGERGQILGLRKSGEEFPAEAAISHLGAKGARIYSVVLRDVTERRRAHETQRFLADAGETLASSLGPLETVRNTSRLAVPSIADACVVNVYHEGQFLGAAVAHVDAPRAEYLERVRSEDPIDREGNHPVAHAMRILRTVAWPARPGYAALPADAIQCADDIFDQPPASAILVPLVAREQVLGIMSLYREKTSYDDSDIFLAEELARRAATAMDNARLHDLVLSGVRARDDMIGIVSHDLRNPVNAIKMLTGVMLDRDGSEIKPAEMADYAGVIRQAAEQMDSLIRDLLDVTRVEAGRLVVAPTRQETEELLSDTLRTLAPVAQEKGLTLRLSAPDAIPDVDADPERFRQAVSNLVGNAVKFSPSGGEIMVRVASLDNEVLFSVSDSGRGMTPDQLAHAFDRFWQSSRTDRQGAGLGLAIAKGIIEAHGGRIWAESSPGNGSTFYFTVPAAARET